MIYRMKGKIIMIDHFKITWKVHLKIIILAYILVFIFYNNVSVILDKFFLNEYIFLPTSNIIINVYLHIIALMIPVSIIHEIIHGVVFKLYGGKIRFGYKILYAYTMETSGMSIERSKFFIILLSPLILITILCLLLPPWISGMVFLINFLGSLGDIYMSVYLCKFNKNCKIIDRSYGYDIIMKG